MKHTEFCLPTLRACILSSMGLRPWLSGASAFLSFRILAFLQTQYLIICPRLFKRSHNKQQLTMLIRWIERLWTLPTTVDLIGEKCYINYHKFVPTLDTRLYLGEWKEVSDQSASEMMTFFLGCTEQFSTLRDIRWASLYIPVSATGNFCWQSCPKPTHLCQYYGKLRLHGHRLEQNTENDGGVCEPFCSQAGCPDLGTWLPVGGWFAERWQTRLQLPLRVELALHLLPLWPLLLSDESVSSAFQLKAYFLSWETTSENTFLMQIRSGFKSAQQRLYNLIWRKLSAVLCDHFSRSPHIIYHRIDIARKPFKIA